jgi:DNA-binding transcriptional ArsR family regulator
MGGDCVVIVETGRAAALLDPVRIRILAELREPESAAGVARRIGAPRQRVGYHVRALLEAGLIREVGDRRRGNYVERLLQALGRYYIIGPQALGVLAPDRAEFQDRRSNDYAIAAASRTIVEVAALRERAVASGKQVPTLTLEGEVRFGSVERQGAFAVELAEMLAELRAKYHDDAAERGRSFRVVVSGHPAG